MTAREAAGNVAILLATLATLDAEEVSGAAAAALLGVAPPDSWPPEFNDTHTRQWMRDMLGKHAGDPGFGSWYIVGNGRLVGTGGYKGPPTANGEVEIGYSVIPEQRLKGFASGAVQLLVAHAFRDGRVTAVLAETTIELVGSQAVLSRCGFKLIERIPNEEFGEILCYRRLRS